VRGKVRDILSCGDDLLICATDRVSAFDRVLTTIPWKGEVLTGLSLYHFENTADIVRNHVVEAVTARTMRVRRCQVFPVEIVVRGYLTGSAWRDYQRTGEVSGIRLPSGMRFNQRFNDPLLTPATKAERGKHDVPISASEVLARGMVSEEVWSEVVRTAHELYRRGGRIAADRGLILVDTKYEMGLVDNELILADEVHTPDSSRYWFADTYQELFEAGHRQRKLDKEYLRQWLMDRGYSGEGRPPLIPDELRLELGRRYVEAFELLTGIEFRPESSSVEEESRVLSTIVDTMR
jgi:phosphoribosylaminoimidazole-succinocarboxamide synthase